MSSADDADAVPWRALLAETEQRLTGAGSSTAAIDARRIVEEASGFEGAEFFLGLDEFATVRGVAALDAMVARRLGGEPLQYVLGRWGFRSLDLMVDRRVLIPRPETEVVAGVAIAELQRIAAAGERSELLAVDLGTGSGAIGLSIAAERNDTDVVMTDVSADALAVARANLTGIGSAATRVLLSEGVWFDALPPEVVGRVDLVVSNPPYVATADDLPDEVADWEPTNALIAGDAGTESLAILVAGAALWLRSGGALVLEMAPHQTDEIARSAVAAGYVDVEIMNDLSGRQRLVRARVR